MKLLIWQITKNLMPHSLDPDRIHQELLNVARKNGILSEDEKDLIESIRENLEKYYTILDEYYEDKIISSEEHHNLHAARKIIMNQAIEVAKSDDHVTQEEFNLLNALKTILMDLEEDEHY